LCFGGSTAATTGFLTEVEADESSILVVILIIVIIIVVIIVVVVVVVIVTIDCGDERFAQIGVGRSGRFGKETLKGASSDAFARLETQLSQQCGGAASSNAGTLHTAAKSTRNFFACSCEIASSVGVYERHSMSNVLRPILWPGFTPSFLHWFWPMSRAVRLRFTTDDVVARC
jgi:hypothetical protein